MQTGLWFGSTKERARLEDQGVDTGLYKRSVKRNLDLNTNVRADAKHV